MPTRRLRPLFAVTIAAACSSGDPISLPAWSPPPPAAPPTPLLASWQADAEGVPWVDHDGTGRAIVLDVYLSRPDPRARSVVVVLGPNPDGAIGQDVPMSCADGTVVAELDRAVFDAGHAAAMAIDPDAYDGGALAGPSLRTEIVPPDPTATYALLVCLRDAQGRLAMQKDGLAQSVSARPTAYSRAVLTPSGWISYSRFFRGAIIGYDVQRGERVETRVTGQRRHPGYDCSLVRFSDGRALTLRLDARFWIASAGRFQLGARLAVGDELLSDSHGRVRITAIDADGDDSSCPGAEALDVGWPDTYFEDGFLIHDAGRAASPRPAGGRSSPATTAANAPVVVQPAAESFDCMLDVGIDARQLPPTARAVAIAVSPHTGLRGARAQARCDDIVAELPRDLIDRAPSLAFTLHGEHIDCDGEYDVVACLRDASGALRPAEPMARYGRAGPTCVAEGTPIETEAGPRAVETLRPGDALITIAPGDGSRVRVAVHRIRIHEQRPVAAFTLSSGDVLRVTAEHPIYVVERGDFVIARDVQPGATLLSGDGAPVVVRSRTAFDQPARVYDVTVDAPHSYLASGVLVHNY